MSEIDFDSPQKDLAKDSQEQAKEAEPESTAESSDREKSLEQKLQAEVKKSAELAKRTLYLQADLVNSQRQAEKRIADARDETSVKYIEAMISLKEDLERALSIAEEGKQSAALTEGLNMLVTKIDSLLESDDVRRIEIPDNASLDTRFHEAVAFSDATDKKDGTIISIVRNGYTYRGKVIKVALVEVARASQEELGRHEEISVKSGSQAGEIGS
jgi:molecular chaperone GrpE